MSAVLRLRPPGPGLALLALGALLLGSCSDDAGPADGRERRDRGGPTARAAIPVDVEPVRRGDVARVLSATARLQPVREVSVVARLSARLLELPVDFGDEVAEGEQLARLDDTEARHQLDESEADAAQRRSDSLRARRTFDQGLLAREPYEQAASARETAEARAEQARLRLSWARIRAPLAGVVVRRSAEVGQVVSAGQEIVAVADVSRLRADVDLPERDLGLVRPGQDVEIHVDPYPDHVFRARVERIAPTVDSASGTFRVRVEMEPSHEGRPRLLPGLFARVRLLVDRRDGVLVVPRRALLVDRESPAVFVARDGTATLAELETGYQDGERIEVRSGLSEGDRVIVLGQDALAPGSPVRVVGEATAPEGDGRDDGEAPPDGIAGRTEPAGGATPGGGPGRGRGPGGPMDAERVEAMLARFQQDPQFKERWDEAVEKDPELATDAEKKAAFVRETMRALRGGRRGGR